MGKDRIRQNKVEGKSQLFCDLEHFVKRLRQIKEDSNSHICQFPAEIKIITPPPKYNSALM